MKRREPGLQIATAFRSTVRSTRVSGGEPPVHLAARESSSRSTRREPLRSVDGETIPAVDTPWRLEKLIRAIVQTRSPFILDGPDVLSALSSTAEAIATSLLQYTPHCDLWIGEDVELQKEALHVHAASQRTRLKPLISFLSEREMPPPQAAFPARYSRFNRVSLDYLMPRLLKNEEDLVSRLEGHFDDAVLSCKATCILEGVLQGEQRMLTELYELWTSVPASVPASNGKASSEISGSNNQPNRTFPRPAE